MARLASRAPTAAGSRSSPRGSSGAGARSLADREGGGHHQRRREQHHGGGGHQSPARIGGREADHHEAQRHREQGPAQPVDAAPELGQPPQPEQARRAGVPGEAPDDGERRSHQRGQGEWRGPRRVPGERSPEHPPERAPGERAGGGHRQARQPEGRPPAGGFPGGRPPGSPARAAGGSAHPVRPRGRQAQRPPPPPRRRPVPARRPARPAGRESRNPAPSSAARGRFSQKISRQVEKLRMAAP